jgi:hypothetical protein
MAVTVKIYSGCFAKSTLLFYLTFNMQHASEVRRYSAIWLKPHENEKKGKEGAMR